MDPRTLLTGIAIDWRAGNGCRKESTEGLCVSATIAYPAMFVSDGAEIHLAGERRGFCSMMSSDSPSSARTLS
jgi:hypothetical protein